MTLSTQMNSLNEDYCWKEIALGTQTGSEQMVLQVLVWRIQTMKFQTQMVHLIPCTKTFNSSQGLDVCELQTSETLHNAQLDSDSLDWMIVACSHTMVVMRRRMMLNDLIIRFYIIPIQMITE